VLIIAALAALAVGLWIAYQRSETFREIVSAAWLEVQQAIDRAWRVMRPILQAMGDFLSELAGAAERVANAFNKVIAVGQKIGGAVSGALGGGNLGGLTPEQIFGFKSMPAKAPSGSDSYMGPVAGRSVTQNVTFNGITDPALLAQMTGDELAWALRAG